MLYREYDDNTLKTLQSIQLMMLRDFDALCRKNGIDYFAVGGTAIGVVRHKGFIPWDDDIDLGLLRKDYNRFLEIADGAYNGKYRLLTAEADPKYPLMTCRWTLTGTVFREECMKNLDCDFGIFLDLYSFEYIPENERAMRRQWLEAWFWGKLLVMYWVRRPSLYFAGLRAKLAYAVCTAGYYGLRLLRIRPHYLHRKAKEATTRYSGTETDRIAYMFDPKPFLSILRISDIFPMKRAVFGGVEINIPGNIDGYLSLRYGDYMTLPPEGRRHNHPPSELDFGKYAKTASP